ncbi:aquaporin [Neolentinus lepideus HHB14362 ss-1]|uniref:Aquaporin n=1 Tax=Neolentinus lepideus HHB14362 ss-1 TaxID=1314782 RepID=A0A165TYD2_9AGAM|nr:aquaporin [Neolentinus lepideus HHB14362 ss-1]
MSPSEHRPSIDSAATAAPSHSSGDAADGRRQKSGGGRAKEKRRKLQVDPLNPSQPKPPPVPPVQGNPVPGRELDVPGEVTRYPNTWAKIRNFIREPVAEFLGTMLLCIFGNGVNCQVVLSTNRDISPMSKGDYLSISFGWAIGLAIAVWISGGVSGGHVNPAVTLALAVLRRFPWKKVPIYMLAQLLGSLCGAGIAYANYYHAIDIYEGGARTVPGTAVLFSSYPLDYLTNASAFFSEFLGTAILVLVVFMLMDASNGAPPTGLVPLALFVTLLGISASLGMETGFSINPARDLGPRIFTAMVGYGKDVFTFKHEWWIWGPVAGAFAGGLSGALVYDVFIFRGAESIINTPDAAARKRGAHARHEQRPNPAGVEIV